MDFSEVSESCNTLTALNEQISQLGFGCGEDGATERFTGSSIAEISPPATSLTAPPVVGSPEVFDQHCTNVYVANLPPSADAVKIRELFGSVGKVLHVKVLLDIATGISRGIAFVMFEDLPTARRACALRNKAILDGSVLQVRLAERSALHASPDSHVRSCTVYIRNVPGNVHKEEVRRYCAQSYGAVVDVVPHPQSCELGGPSPFNMVFVTFAKVDDACRCVEMIDGKTPFPLPSASHPFTMAKMISDIGGEMRKSILLRRRGSEPVPSSTIGKSGSGATHHHLQAHHPHQHQQTLHQVHSNHTVAPYVQVSPHGVPLIPLTTPPPSPSNPSIVPHGGSEHRMAPHPTFVLAPPSHTPSMQPTNYASPMMLSQLFTQSPSLYTGSGGAAPAPNDFVPRDTQQVLLQDGYGGIFAPNSSHAAVRSGAPIGNAPQYVFVSLTPQQYFVS